ncbi:MAG: Lrp/AsnC ligand binding domain-containing protein [Candidatus Aenigmarchaeota archaeon]|nr:Lrp/AsnC ligand binding domain-containing protein [Candidatus Aenigmarchaeota archaeon]
MEAYVLITVDPNMDNQVFKAIQKLPEVKETHILFGDWDVVAKLEMGNPEQLGSIVIAKIRSIEGVRQTKTLIVAR